MKKEGNNLKNNVSDNNNVKEVLLKIKKRIAIGAIAIFAVNCCELWNNTNISHVQAICLSLYLSLAISIIGYFAMKSIVMKLIK